MSSNISEFIDDRSFDDKDEGYDYYISGDDESDNDDDYITNRRRALEEARISKEKRDAKRDNAYKARINCQLKDCGKVLEGKLCWLKKKPTVAPQVPAAAVPTPALVLSEIPSVLVETTPICEEIPEKPHVVEKFADIMEEQTKEWQTIKRKIVKTKPIDDQRYTPSTPRNAEQQSYNNNKPYRPDVQQQRTDNNRYPQQSKPYNNPGMCKHIVNGDVCPFGDNCRFSHVISSAPVPIMKSRKIWMCKHLNNCSHGNNCIYAHNVDEVRAAVSKCTNCNRVKRIGEVEYKNTVYERKCMRLHLNESIENFIKRTT
jgi:CCCH-type zinc finger